MSRHQFFKQCKFMSNSLCIQDLIKKLCFLAGFTLIGKTTIKPCVVKIKNYSCMPDKLLKKDVKTYWQRKYLCIFP